MISIFSRQRISRWCVYIVLILVNIAYCPGIILTANYNIIMAVIATAIIISISLNVKEDFTFAVSSYLYYGTFAMLLCSIVFLFSNVFLFEATSNIFLTITCFLFGYCNNDYNEEFIVKCMKIYAVSALFLGLYSISTNLGGFVITEQYAFNLKNSSGVLLGTAIIFCVFILTATKSKFQTIFWTIVVFLLTASLLTFRCRTAIIAIMISIIIIAYRSGIMFSILQRPLMLLSCIAIISILLYFNIIPCGFIYDSLFANTDTSSLDSVSSGRITHFNRALQVFLNDPILGSSSQNIHLPSIDNFIINILGRYGLIGGLLMFPPYILAFVICVYGILHNSMQNSYPFFALLIILLTSFTESPFPFGPGTPVICAWFLLGWWCKASKLETIQKAS